PGEKDPPIADSLIAMEGHLFEQERRKGKDRTQPVCCEEQENGEPVVDQAEADPDDSADHANGLDDGRHKLDEHEVGEDYHPHRAVLRVEEDAAVPPEYIGEP